jgi:Mycobacterial 2 TMS Phage Holin (M2 Hol) Family
MAMKYTPGTYAKAIVALLITAVTTASGLARGLDFSGLDVGQWMSVLGAALTAGAGVFVVPNKPTDAPQAPADQIITGLQDVIAARDHAVSEIERVRQAASDIVGQVPVIGPLAQQVIDSIHPR